MSGLLKWFRTRSVLSPLLSTSANCHRNRLLVGCRIDLRRSRSRSSSSNIDLENLVRVDGRSTVTMAANRRNEESPCCDFMIVGLGNYCWPNTRHSVGMAAVDRLASYLCGQWDPGTGTYGGSVCQAVVRKDDAVVVRLLLFKPKALMNVNGRSVARTARTLGVAPDRIYLVHDELDRAPGKFHLKENGSAGGHKGVLSCMKCLQSNAMPRLRIGIGRPSSKSLVVPYVTGTFPSDHLPLVERAMDLGLQDLLGHVMGRV
ncbi:probable peptidyl-tRNA hydrolase [Aplysia californica]|uniref:Probable peptidyl-tRNA hydrolase n=1 Tax=Aplysia californica TaxID=6500 RepID=A0ABM1VPE6_APLCA|nr:probable peptidyl-tRNA hydrolase [Aplysia californica]